MADDPGWTSVVVQLDPPSERATVAALGTRWRDGAWFAIPIELGIIEVSVPATAERGLARIEAMAARSSRRTVPSALDPASFPGGVVSPDLPATLVVARRLMATRLSRRTSFFELTDDSVARSVHELAMTIDLPAVDLLHATATWLDRVHERRATGDEPTSTEPASPKLVAEARALHIHVVQLCGPDPSEGRLADERDLFRRWTEAMT